MKGISPNALDGLTKEMQMPRSPVTVREFVAMLQTLDQDALIVTTRRRCNCGHLDCRDFADEPCLQIYEADETQNHSGQKMVLIQPYKDKDSTAWGKQGGQISKEQ